MENGSSSEHGPEGLFLQALIDEVITAHAGRHPGIISEAIVERIAATYVMAPREAQHREQRKNHLERTRRFSHEVYRIIAGEPEIAPAREIAARLHRSFLLTRRPPAATPPADRS